MWTDNDVLAQYEPFIYGLTHKCPRFWRSDLQQELRYCLLKWFRRLNGQLRSDFVHKNLKKIAKSFEMLERNRGMRDCPDPIDWDEVQHRARECGYTVTQLGNHTIYEKHV